MIGKLTEEAWVLYLKILDVNRASSYSIEHESRINRLTDRIYLRYLRRRCAMELHLTKKGKGFQ
ncbi:hypothetical protein EKO24_018195 [Candidatus Methylobacter oryzae]|uniref:Uncharacterized protein n=1 Tax=Candidatus Methylobacter oryzae TaxID=2497749 RepID=A0ABY3C632_9GAMM|nr:hypothetical protein EKO24_018195 [Candidatus Methylobacter oryzae]